MTFKIIENPTFTLPVDVKMPDGTVQVLTTRFRGVSDDKADAFYADGKSGLKGLMTEAIEGFEDVQPAEGAAVEFAERGCALYAQIIGKPYCLTALHTAYIGAMAGVAGPRRGN